jgi:hypothetical protein
MSIFGGRPAYPKDRDLVRVVAAAAARVVGKLETLDPSSLDLSAETRSLLRDERRSLRSHIERCAHVFAWSLPRDEKPFSDLTLIAFADGLGFFSLLAKECSVGTVVYHDSSDVLRCDAKTIGDATGNTADYYVFGDIDELEFITNRYSILCDVFVSSDATAHIEKLSPFLDTLCQRSNGAMSFGLGVDKRAFSKPARERERPSTPSARFCDALARAGFHMSVVRGYSNTFPLGVPQCVADFLDRAVLLARGQTPGPVVRGCESLVLCGSRAAGRRAPREKTPTAVSPNRTPTATHESDEVLVG